MDFVEATKTCLRKYFTFSGRAQRSEYWWFYLFTIIVGIVAAIFDGAIFGWVNADEGPIGSLTSLALLIPSLSAGWRRLHDTGRSGWWIGGGIIAIVVMAIILIVAAVTNGDDVFASGDSVVFGVLAIIFALGILAYIITLLVFFCQDSHPGDNRYGPSPKYDAGASVFD
jgi:uncharacterized membrane protein YhaH (DUF805 family)